VGGHSQLRTLGIGPLDFWFGDLRNVTAAMDCAREHIAVLPTNPCDPMQRPANYPRIWVELYHLGLGQGDTFTLGVIVGGLFFAAAILVLPGAAGWPATVLYALLLCSPAAMLGVERGNVDILLFAFVVAAVLVSRRGLWGLILADALIGLAAVLKIFPIFATGFLALRRSRRGLISIVAILVGFAAYAVAIRHELSQIRQALPQRNEYSYGLRRFSDWVSAGVEGSKAKSASLPSWDVLVVVVVVVVAWLSARRIRPGLQPEEDPDPAALRDLDLFWAGACVYIGTYAIARNYDYRLVFCLMTVPQLCRWVAAGSKLAGGAVAGLLGVMWLDADWISYPGIRSLLDRWDHFTEVGPTSQILPLAAIAQLWLFIALVVLLAATAPRRARLRLAHAGEIRARHAQ
jgi:hypothetical protein